MMQSQMQCCVWWSGSQAYESLCCASAAQTCHKSFTFTFPGMSLEARLSLAPHLPSIWNSSLMARHASNYLRDFSIVLCLEFLPLGICMTASFSSMKSQLKCYFRGIFPTTSGKVLILPTPASIIVFQTLVYCLLVCLSSIAFASYQNISSVKAETCFPVYLLLNLVCSKLPKLLYVILASNFTT